MNKFNRRQPVHISGISKTRPNQALTVREINERFTTGKPVPVAKTPIHEPQLDIGNNPMRRPYCDLVDIAEYKEILDVKLNESTSLLTEKQKEFLSVQEKIKKDSYDNLVSQLSEKFKSPLQT